VNYAVIEFQRQLEAALGDLADDLAGMRQQKIRLQAEVRLVPAVAESGHSKSLLEEIGRKEGELQGIADRLLSATPESIESRVGEIRSFVRSGLNDLRDLLRKDTALARAELLKHSGEITMTRHMIRSGACMLLGVNGICSEPIGPKAPRLPVAASDGCGGLQRPEDATP
jgi:hypothetical protein